ncbi:STAS domain-containing protein [Pseudonocardia sp.]|uniref:STAS domain-containing protein n=1 Tax=Pseudonocardia sp. TaxID=60912 RepID=UPI00262F56C5|nr:STAS domain-containing protein [Pseudonocardia sp.]
MAQRLQSIVHNRAQTGVLELVGDLDIATEPALRAVLAELRAHHVLVVDLHGVLFCGARALRVLLDAASERAAGDHVLVLAHRPPMVARLIELLPVRCHPHPVPDDPTAVRISWAGPRSAPGA